MSYVECCALYVRYESGRLIAVTPFVAKVLEGAQASSVFQVSIFVFLRHSFDVSFRHQICHSTTLVFLDDLRGVRLYV